MSHEIENLLSECIMIQSNIKNEELPTHSRMFGSVPICQSDESK